MKNFPQVSSESDHHVTLLIFFVTRKSVHHSMSNHHHHHHHHLTTTINTTIRPQPPFDYEQRWWQGLETTCLESLVSFFLLHFLFLLIIIYRTTKLPRWRPKKDDYQQLQRPNNNANDRARDDTSRSPGKFSFFYIFIFYWVMSTEWLI